MKKLPLKIITVLILTILSVVIVFFGVTTVRFLWFRPLVVAGNSMAPTLSDGSLIYVDTTVRPQVGDVACFFHVPEGLKEGEALPSAEYYGANGYLRSMPIWGLRVAETYSGGYAILVKRVAAVAGDTVAFRSETVDGAHLIALYRNGDRVQEEDILMLDVNAMDAATQTYAHAWAERHGIENVHTLEAIPSYTVPTGCVYVLGDNRGGSTDSRVFGAVDAALFIGVVRGK